MSENPYITYTAKDGNTVKTVAPIVKNAKGKYEVVIAVVYTPEGLPISLLICQDTKEVPSAEWEPLQPIG